MSEALIVNLTIFLIACIIHELGHYIGYLSFGFKPNIKITKFGVIEIGNNVIYKVIPYQLILIAYLGIAFGWLFLSILSKYGFNITSVFVIYLFACMFDIVTIINMFSIKKEWNKLTILEIYKLKLKEIIENAKKEQSQNK